MSLQEIKLLEQSYGQFNVYNRYTIKDNAELLKKCLPKGKLWDIELPDEKQIKLYGIPSAEAFGDLNVTLPGSTIQVETPIIYGTHPALLPGDSVYSIGGDLTNDSSTVSITVSMVEFLGPDDANFGVSFPVGMVIPPSGMITALWEFKPFNQIDDTYIYNCVARVHSNATNSPHDVVLNGRATKLLPTFSPDPADYGTLYNPPWGLPVILPVTITNPFNEVLNITGLGLNGGDVGWFAVDYLNGYVLPALGTLVFNIEFTPNAQRSYAVSHYATFKFAGETLNFAQVFGTSIADVFYS